jgi:hypothetical protein
MLGVVAFVVFLTVMMRGCGGMMGGTGGCCGMGAGRRRSTEYAGDERMNSDEVRRAHGPAVQPGEGRGREASHHRQPGRDAV